MSHTAADPIRVLHVDDDPELAEVVAIQLERLHEAVTVTQARDASEGLERLDAESVDCVVSDLEMPGMDGLAFLREVRERHGDLPFILFTGKGSEEIASEAISAGVTEYLQKGTGIDRFEVLAHRIDHAVTERRAREAAAESERMFSTLVENLPGMVYRCQIAPGWPMEYVSVGCETVSGYPADAIESGEVTWGEEVIHPDDQEDVWEPVEAAIETGESFTLTYRILTADGETRWVWEQGSPVAEDGELSYLEGFIADVTDRRKRREALQHERAVTEYALDALDDAFYVVDHETGDLLRWNDRVPEYTGYTDAELAAMTVFDLVPDEETETIVQAGEAALAGEDQPLELEVERKDGDRIPVEVRGSTITDEDGTVLGICSIARDVTDRKQREERLRQFAHVVSHDLRNPLRVVQGRVELARETGDLDHLEAVETAAERMDDMIDDLLTLALEGQTVGETESVDVCDVARRAWTTVETGEATLELDGPGTVEADPDRLQDVFSNLFRNAVEHSDATRRSLTLEEAVERGESPDASAVASEGSQPLRVRVAGVEGGFAVEDDGPGIPADARESVFDNGYSTADAGTGLGLSIVRNVAEAHGWTVRATDGEWGGARFVFQT
jgi:PAS domain S-box-containing protein